MNSTSDTYEGMKSLVYSVFHAARNTRGYSLGQAFAYTYDEMENIMSEGIIQKLYILAALFSCASDNNIALDVRDSFTEWVADELLGAAKLFKSDYGEFAQYPDLEHDLIAVKQKYLLGELGAAYVDASRIASSI